MRSNAPPGGRTCCPTASAAHDRGMCHHGSRNGTGPGQRSCTPQGYDLCSQDLDGVIDANMDEIETMLVPEGTLNLAEGQYHADMISIMLMAFPHMFSAATNQ